MLSATRNLSTIHRQSGFLNAVEDCPDIAVLHGYGVDEHLTISGKIFVNPEESGRRDRTEKEYGAVVFADKIGSGRRAARTNKRITV